MPSLLSNQISALGVRPGGVLLVHSSLRSIGPLDGGAETLIEALLEALGSQGSLLFPALSYTSVKPANPVFDLNQTPGCVGTLAEVFRLRPGTLRSIHPTHSVCGIGPVAADLLSGHEADSTPVGPHSPFARLPEVAGQILFIGCGLGPNTSMHGVEELVIPPYLFGGWTEYTIRLGEGREMRMNVHRHNFAGWIQRYDRVAGLLDDSALRQGRVLRAACHLVEAAALWPAALKALQKDPYFLCGVDDMNITGTFLDEITHDIPSASWGEAEWAADFDAMRAVGIDTVILIRAGYRDRATFNSSVLSREQPMRPAYLDLVDLYLTQAERCGMQFYFGIYDSGRYWHEGKPEREVEINLRFTEEVAEKYAGRKAFAGWYMTHEIHEHNEAVTRLIERLARHVKGLKDGPVLMSPYVRGRKQFDDNPITPEEHERQWDAIFAMLSGFVDIVAFQDGHVEFSELPTYLEINNRLARKHGLRPWSNIETFERGMPINFLPINWWNLRYKIEAARASGVEKLITFEFSHFLSPNSIYPSAHNLYRRYQEFIENQ